MQASISKLTFFPVSIRVFIIAIIETLVTIFVKIFNAPPSQDVCIDKWENLETSLKLAIVTGGNTGIGYYTALGLAKSDFTVVLACRSESKGTKAVDSIVSESGNDKIHFIKLDLTDFKSISEFVSTLNAKFPQKLDLLINNAGVMDIPFQTDSKGIELQFSTNYLGHFFLTNLLLEKLSDSAKIINLTSCAHYAATKIDKKSIYSLDNYSRLGNYAQSKLANCLFTIKLAKMFQDTNKRVNCVHPGAVFTDLYYGNYIMSLLVPIAAKFGLFKSAESGSLTVLMVALDENITETGKYFADMEQVESSIYANDMEMANELWEFSVSILKAS